MPKLNDLDAQIIEAAERVGYSLAALSKELGIHRSTIYNRLRKLPKPKPLVAGSVRGMEDKLEVELLPTEGKIKRFILTSAQNNTHVHLPTWKALRRLAKFYGAKIMVGTFSYNQNAFGKLSVKAGTEKHDKDLWFDKRIKDYRSDTRVELAPGLVWCGEMNILPTAEHPLSGLQTYSGRKSAIFPHAKMALNSIAAMKGEGVKFNYTTGTVTQMNYIQKKSGLKGEHHHAYGGVLVEVDSDGTWFVRQIESTKSGTIQDLDVIATPDGVTEGNQIEAITWGDFHAASIDPLVTNCAVNKDTGMLDTLKPKYQFIHDLFEGVSVNHHGANDPHARFASYIRGFDSVPAEIANTHNVLWAYTRDNVDTIIVDSNHDNWIMRWLKEHDYRRDPKNAVLFLEAQLAVYRAMSEHQKFNLTQWVIQWAEKNFLAKHPLPPSRTVKFLNADDSFLTCKDTIENGQHGHLGPNGARGTPKNLNCVGRRANTGHTHVAEIINGLYVAGCSCDLDQGYNRGPSGWSHSHILTYPSGKRTIITIYRGRWRAGEN